MFASSIQNPIENIYCTEYGIPIRNLWHMLVYAWKELPLEKYCTTLDIDISPSLDALLASILSRLISQRLKIGLGRSYVNHKKLIRGIKGRIDFTDSLKYRTFAHGQAYCEFYQYSSNAPKNQIVRSTLARLIQTGNFGPDRSAADALRHNLRTLTRSLDDIDVIELKVDFIRRQQFSRNDADYCLMMAICELILQKYMPTDSGGYYKLPTINRTELVIYNLYERFVANFYLVHLKGWDVIPKKTLKWHEKIPNKYLPKMVPDLVMKEKSTGRILMLDTKFTSQILIKNQWGGEIFNSGHLYQLYAYLKTQEHLSDQHRQASGILLYPAAQYSLSERIELNDHKMRIECVDLTIDWQDIERQLLNLVIEYK